MKYCITTFFTMLLCLELSAQAPDITINWAEPILEREVFFHETIGANDTEFYTIGFESRGFFKGSDFRVRKYVLNDFSIQYDVTIPRFDYKDQRARFSSARLVNKDVHLFFSVYSGSEDLSYLIQLVVNEAGEVSPIREISRVRAEKFSEVNQGFYYSKDSSQVLLFSDLPYEKDGDEMFRIQLFDQSYVEYWHQTVTLPYSDKSFVLISQSVANNGDVFVAGYAKPDKSKGEEKVKGSSNQAYKLFRISKNSEQVVEYDLGMGDKFISSLDIYTDFAEGVVAIAGFYSDEEVGSAKGSFYISLDQKKLETRTSSFEPFSDAFMTRLMSERDVKRGKELWSFKIKELVKREDGGVVVVGEQSYAKTYTNSTPNGGFSTTTVYGANDIIAIHIKADGNMGWTAHIPKTQSDETKKYLSYVLLVDGDQLHFVFNDHRKNLKRLQKGKDLKTYSGGRSSVAILASIDGKGNVTRRELFSADDAKTVLCPGSAYPLDRNQVLLFGVRDWYAKFGTMSILD